MIQIETNEKGVTRCIIAGGRGNPLTPDLLDSLNATLDVLVTNPPKALIIDANGAPIFSGGFALPIVAYWERERLKKFFEGFLDILYKIMSIPCVTITVLDGHAIAGGFILSLATDMRIVRDTNIKFGLSEVDLGVALPAGAGVLFEWRTSPKEALFYSMTGTLFDPHRAKEIGYAHAVVENPMEEAMNIAENLAQKPGMGVGNTRVFFNARIIQEMKKADDAFMESFLDTWFSSEGQEAIRSLAQKLTKK